MNETEAAMEGQISAPAGGPEPAEIRDANLKFESENTSFTPPFDAKLPPVLEKLQFVRSSLRLRYQAEVDLIRRRHGSLDKIRSDLGLSARKICQLLMVDPSAWNRWTKGSGQAPPHVWRALEWYLLAAEKMPGLTPNFFLERPAVQLQPAAAEEVKNLSVEQSRLLARLQTLEERSDRLFSDLKSAQRTIRVYELAGTLIALLLAGFVVWLLWRARA